MYEIQKNVPIPGGLDEPPSAQWKYPFLKMAIGDFFFVPGTNVKSVRTRASVTGKRYERKFMTRTMFMRESIEGWVECQSDAQGAVQGTGVWRTE